MKVKMRERPSYLLLDPHYERRLLEGDIVEIGSIINCMQHFNIWHKKKFNIELNPYIKGYVEALLPVAVSSRYVIGKNSYQVIEE